MPTFEFECKKCNEYYSEITSHDATGKYTKIKCPHCKSKSKKLLISAPNFAFAEPQGTDRWNNTSTGHDYRFKHNIPAVKAEREMAAALSHMGTDPYGSGDDIEMDTGIHDAESRKGLS